MSVPSPETVMRPLGTRRRRASDGNGADGCRHPLGLRSRLGPAARQNHQSEAADRSRLLSSLEHTPLPGPPGADLKTRALWVRSREAERARPPRSTYDDRSVRLGSDRIERQSPGRRLQGSYQRPAAAQLGPQRVCHCRDVKKEDGQNSATHCSPYENWPEFVLLRGLSGSLPDMDYAGLRDPTRNRSPAVCTSYAVELFAPSPERSVEF